MNNLENLDIEIKSLVKNYKDGKISQEETIIKFERILKDLITIYGSKQKSLAALKKKFLEAVFRIKKYKLLDEQFKQGVKEFTVLRNNTRFSI